LGFDDIMSEEKKSARQILLDGNRDGFPIDIKGY